MTGRPRPRVLLPLLVLPLLAGAAAAAALATPDLTEVERDPVFSGGLPEPAQPQPEPAAAPSTAVAPPAARDGLDWLGEAVLVAWLVAGLAGLALLVWVIARRRRRRAGGPRLREPHRKASVGGAGDEDQRPLLAALDASLAALADDDRDPRRAVIACWVRLAEAATDAGVPQYPADTAGDLVERLLRGHRVSEPVLAWLAEVYRLARYATHEVDESMRTSARAALHRLREELDQDVPAGSPASAGATA